MNLLLWIGILAAQDAAPASLYDRAAAASVEVLVDGRLSGSGWFATAEGHVVTAAHFTWSAKGPIEVRSPKRGRLEARAIAFDRGHDLALLKVTEADKPFPTLPIRKAMPAPPGEIYLFGSAQFRHGLLLTGRVARKRPTFEYFADQGCAVRIYHVTGPSPRGSSGGCWLDAEGGVVGNQSGMMTEGKSASGIGFVAPPEAIRRLLETRTSARTPDAGIAVEELDEQAAAYIRKFPAGSRGVVAALVLEEGPAARAGLTKRALITHAGGKALETRDDFYRHLRSKKPGDEVSLTVHKPGTNSPEKIRVTLAALEN